MYDLGVEGEMDPLEFWTEILQLDDTSLFKLQLRELMLRVLVIPIGSAGVERIISDYNLLKSPLRTRFKTETLDNHLFIRRNGPPIAYLNMEPVLKSWNANFMSSADPTRRGPKPIEKGVSHSIIFT